MNETSTSTNHVKWHYEQCKRMLLSDVYKTLYNNVQHISANRPELAIMRVTGPDSITAIFHLKCL